MMRLWKTIICIDMERGFTLVVPIYNKIKTLKKSLDTILNYHGEYPFRCILIDDDSDDGCSEIAMQYDREYPDVFTYYRIVHHGNRTPAYARNLGIKLCDTELIGFLDAGDEIRPGFIDRGCDFLEKHPEYSLYGNGCYFRWINNNGKYWDEQRKYLTDNIKGFTDYINSYAGDIHFSANIYRTKLVRHIMFKNEYGEDVVFKFKYVFRFPNIYIDNSTCESTVWCKESSDSEGWNIQRTSKHWLVEIMDNVKKDIPEFNYNFYVDEKTGNIMYHITT